MSVLYVNGCIILGFLFLLYSGYKKGFLFKVISLLSFFFMGMLSWWLSSIFQHTYDLFPRSYAVFQGTFLEEMIYDSLNRFTWFLCIFIIGQIVLLCIRPFLKIVNEIPVLSSVNRYAGMALGAIQGICLCFIAYMICQLPFFQNASKIANESLLRYSEPVAQQLLNYANVPIHELQSFFTSADEGLSIENLQELQAWLQQQNVKEEQIQVVMDALQEETNE